MCGIDDYAKKSLSYNGQAFLLDFDAAKVSGELDLQSKAPYISHSGILHKTSISLLIRTVNSWKF